jgi:hypothetical protein
MHLIAIYGLPALLILMALDSCGLTLPSEVIMPVGGGLAASGHLAFPAVVAVGCAASFLGALIAYGAAARFGAPALTPRSGRSHPVVARRALSYTGPQLLTRPARGSTVDAPPASRLRDAREDLVEDGPVDLVQPRGQRVLVTLAVEDAADGGDQRRPVLALDSLDQERFQTLGGGLVALSGGDHGVDGRLPVQVPSMSVAGSGRWATSLRTWSSASSPVAAR